MNLSGKVIALKEAERKPRINLKGKQDMAERTLSAIRYKIRNQSRYIDEDKQEMTTTDPKQREYRYSVRHFGQWENPEWAEDEEDYDWQEPTPATVKKVEKIWKEALRETGIGKYINKQQSGPSTSEKNWFDFLIVLK
jgi:hypothetical protein